MIDIGRVCVKIAGRDAGRECVIVEKIDSNFVKIDGNTRRKKCNIKHLQLLPKTINIKAKATHEDVSEAMKNAGIKVIEKKKPTAKKEKPASKKESKSKKKKAKK